MKFAAGTSTQASGGVSSDEQERRPEVPAGPFPKRERNVGAKAADRRALLMVIYPVWVMVMAPVFAVLWLAGWWKDL